MKRTATLLLISVFAACAMHRKAVTYELPANMPEAVKKEYTSRCDKGKALYDINCAKCHNTIVKGRTVIPDFTPEKLIGYELRVSNSRHEGSIPETTVNSEELGLIMTFLSYKKKNGR